MRVVVLLCLLLSACSVLGPQTETLRLIVAAQTVECVGEGAQQCLRVRTSPGAAWERFSDPIEGFQHEPGVEVVIDVEVREVADPPADGSSRAYRLIRVVSRSPEEG